MPPNSKGGQLLSARLAQTAEVDPAAAGFRVVSCCEQKPVASPSASRAGIARPEFDKVIAALPPE